jgi:hypothetical protein
MSHIVVRGFELILVAFVVSGLGTTIHYVVKFRERSARIARPDGLAAIRDVSQATRPNVTLRRKRGSV